MSISSKATGLRPGVCTSTTRPTAPYTGQYILETDTNKIYVWNGTSWVEQPSAGMVDAKGDLMVGSAADTVTRLAVGANNTLLLADSAASTGVKWSALSGITTTMTTYTPTWTGSTTNPSIGNGTLTGRYYQVGKLTFVQILMIPGSTTTYGSGIYKWSLPVTGRSQLYGFMSHGVARAWDASTATRYLGQAIFYGDDVNVTIEFSAGTCGNTYPMTWASGDEAVFSFWYEAL